MENNNQEDRATAALIIEVKDNLNTLLNSPNINTPERGKSKASIYKIPQFIKDIQPKAFEPQLVSFGPYHNGKPHLGSMELEKLKAFQRFKTENELEVESIVKRVSSILEDLKGSYDKIVEDENNDWKIYEGKFLQIMVVDACFMLEFLNECPDSLRNLSGDIKRDMLLLENQLPMMLLHDLYSLANKDQLSLSQVKVFKVRYRENESKLTDFRSDLRSVNFKNSVFQSEPDHILFGPDKFSLIFILFFVYFFFFLKNFYKPFL